MIIRVASLKDSAAIADLHIQSWRATNRGMLPDDFLAGPIVKERNRFWKEKLKNPSANQQVLIVEENSIYFGFICIQLHADPIWGTMIENLHVRPSDKKKGIGTQLMKKAAKWILTYAPNQNIWLWAYEYNTIARNYYKGLKGYEAEKFMLPSTAGTSVPSIRYVWESPLRLLSIIQNKKRHALYSFHTNSVAHEQKQCEIKNGIVQSFEMA